MAKKKTERIQYCDLVGGSFFKRGRATYIKDNEGVCVSLRSGRTCGPAIGLIKDGTMVVPLKKSDVLK